MAIVDRKEDDVIDIASPAEQDIRVWEAVQNREVPHRLIELVLAVRT